MRNRWWHNELEPAKLSDDPQGRTHLRSVSSEASRQQQQRDFSFPKQSHQRNSPSGGGLPFRVLSNVLAFFCSPLEHSLWWLAIVAAWMGFSGFVFLVATAGMMLDVGNYLISTGFIIAFGITGYWMVHSWLPRKTK